MRALFRLIVSRRTLTIVGLLALAALVWWVFPTIAINGFRPYEAAWVRWLQIAIFVLVPITRWLWRQIRARRASAALGRGLVDPSDPPGGRLDPSAEEAARLRERFEEAIALLRRASLGTDTPSLWARLRSLGSRQYLYDLPWYVFIGPPGAGKTTALANSGLRFPLAGRLARHGSPADPRIAGVGGTRNCHWWFADEAVFLDTAGRYTTQDSDRQVDAAAWKSFLALLRQSRPRRPINGVIVTVSAGDLLQQSGTEAEAQALAIRSRVHELYDELGVRFPLYVLVTKSDLLAGFSEFFADVGRDERGQVWGVTLPFGERPLEPAALATELGRLEGRLYERLPERLEDERDATRRALLYGFPQQFALLRDRLVRFVDATFAPTRFEARPLVRGVYFASGTQEGSPLDRVMGALARDLRLERWVLPAQHASGRSYFLTRLLRDVVFPEAGLAGVDLRRERRRRWLDGATVGLVAIALLLLTLAWTLSYARNREYLREVSGQLEAVTQTIGATRAGAATDVTALLPTLDRVRTLAETRGTSDGSVPWSMRLGLYQGYKLEAASRSAYRKMLQATFLPSLVAFLEQTLARPAGRDGADAAYDALRTYLMLFDAQHFDREQVWRWYETHGETLLGSDRGLRATLAQHFDALYGRGWVAPPTLPQPGLIAQARASIGRESLPERIYGRLKREAGGDVRDFTVAEQAGPKALLVFERKSGEPLTQGVPGLYTKDGYHKHVAGRVDAVALQLAAEEAWVMGTAVGGLAGAAGSPRMSEAARRLYLEDYRTIWRRFLDDLTVIRQRDLTRTIEITRTLSAPDSPLKTLMKAVEREVTLAAPAETEPGLAGSAIAKERELAGRARTTVTGTPAGAIEKSLVDSHFEDIRLFASGPGGGAPAPADAVVQQLNELYLLLVAAKTALDGGQTPPLDPAAKVVAEAQRQPEPIRSMVQGLASGGTKQVADQTRARQAAEEQRAREQKRLDEQAAREKKALDEQAARETKAAEEQAARDRKRAEEKAAQEKRVADLQQTRERIDADLRAQITPFCLKATSDRYPFVRASSHDVPAEDFTRLFAPGAMLDGFFQKQLAPLVDTSDTPWRFKDPVLGRSPALIQFQRAQVIRDVFFPGGATAPTFRLEFRPLQMDASIKQFTLDVDGKLVSYAHGPQAVVPVQFPGPRGRRQIRASISPPPPSGANAVAFDGTWAPIRMFDSVRVRPTTQAERFEATIAVEGRRAVFEVLATSVRNPFALPELSEFRCPTSL
jgi:type VI secretion system protein ImpL